MSSAELQAAATDLGGRLAWAIAAVLLVGLWVACVSVAFWQIWTLVPSPSRGTWVGVTIALAVGAGLLSWRASAIAPNSLELLGPLLSRLDEQSGTRIMSASQFLTGLAGSAIVVLLIASAAITWVEDDALYASQLEGLRTIFNAGAALLVAAAFEVSALYGWAAAAFEPSGGALSNAAMLAAGFVGALFSAALFAVYLPAVSTLRRRAPAGAPAMAQQGFGDSTFQQLARLLQGLAPLFLALPVPMLVSLFQ